MSRETYGIRQIGKVLATLITTSLALGGLWLTVAGTTDSEHLTGAVAVVLFGAGAAWAIAGPVTAAPRRGPRFGAYFPLAAAIVELPWFVLTVMGFRLMAGDHPSPSPPSSEHVLDMVIALPAMAGLLLGLTGMVRQWARRPMEWLWLVLGGLACALVVKACLKGLVS